jgi:hypothetical protein
MRQRSWIGGGIVALLAMCAGGSPDGVAVAGGNGHGNGPADRDEWTGPTVTVGDASPAGADEPPLPLLRQLLPGDDVLLHRHGRVVPPLARPRRPDLHHEPLRQLTS